jgi:hypothetical protein
MVMARDCFNPNHIWHFLHRTDNLSSGKIVADFASCRLGQGPVPGQLLLDSNPDDDYLKATLKVGAKFTDISK